MEPRQQGQQPYHVPAPFVTHAEMAPVHARIGGLERGQQAVLEAYGHMRGELLGRFDRLESALTAERQTDAKRAAQQPDTQGLNLSVREAFIAVFAIMAGTALLTKMAVDSVERPIENVRKAMDVLP